MSTNSTIFLIDRTTDQEFEFTIKSKHSPYLMSLSTSDTFLFKLFLKRTSEEVLSKSLTIKDKTKGKVVLSLLKDEVSDLYTYNGDNTSTNFVPNLYYAIIECKTHDSGNFTIKLGNVYVQ